MAEPRFAEGITDLHIAHPALDGPVQFGQTDDDSGLILAKENLGATVFLAMSRDQFDRLPRSFCLQPQLGLKPQIRPAGGLAV